MKSFNLQYVKRLRGLHLGINQGGRALKLALLATAVAGATGVAHAQNTGSVFGTVQDKTGAIVPGATITIADTEHGVTQTVKSNGNGEFQLSSLPVGNYILTVDMATFSTAVITDIKVDANQNIKELISLQAGSNETVSVEDTSGSAIDAKSAQLGTLIDDKLIEDLPIDGHNIVALSALLPGVVDVNAPSTFTGDTGGPTYSASGSRNTQNLMLFDGLIWNNLYYNTGVNYPTPNALQEVSVLLNNYKAQYGRNAGSVFNVITKRGTNTIHGAVWDYLQNQLFNAADYISHVNPKDNQNQFGATIGGPIFKNKLFYFGAYQQLIGHLQTTGSVVPPGYAERGLQADGKTPLMCNPMGPFPGMTCASFLKDVTTNGVIGKFVNPLEVAGTNGSQATPENVMAIYNSAYAQAGGTGTSPCLALLQTAANFAGGNNYVGSTKPQPTYAPFAELPTQCLNPVMLNVLNTFVPVAPANAGGILVTKSPRPTGDQNGLIRMDYTLNQKTQLDARYNIVNSSGDFPQGVDSTSAGIATYALLHSYARGHFGNVGMKYVLSPNLLSETRVGYKRFEATQFPDDHRTLNDFGGNFTPNGIPTLPAFSFSNQFSLGSTTQGYQDHINENVEVVQDLIYTKGNHTIQGGFDFLRLQYLTRSDYPGQLSFSTTFTGNSIADGIAGLVNQANAQNRLLQGGIQHDAYFYLQDDWRATPKLTFNLGVRYEIPFQWFERHGQAATFAPGIQSHVFPNAPGGLAFPGDRTVLSSLVPTDFNGLVPRFGVAYDTTGAGKLILRGGFGIVSDAVNANVIGVGEPYHYQISALTPPGGASVPLAGFGVDANGNPNNSILHFPDAFDPAHPLFIKPYSLFFPDPNFRTPYVMAFNVGFQLKIPHAGVLDTNYVGKLARKLTIPVDLNPAIYDCKGGYFMADPTRYCTNASSNVTSTQARLRYAPFNYGGQGIVDILSVGTSSYHALQMQYTQRSGKYLNILSSYTYSKSIDLQTNGQTTANTVPNVFDISSDRGPSDNNVKHNVTLGWVVRFPKVNGFDAPARALLNNWVYSGTYNIHSGRPYSVTINNDTALDGETRQRAALVPGISPYLPNNRHRADKVNAYFNREAFTYPQIGTFSALGRNSFVGPGYIMTNMTLGRDFPISKIREGMRFNFRAEAFNVFNTPNLANPNSQFSCSSTSISTTTHSGVSCDSLTVPNPANPNQTLTQSTPGSFGGVNPATGISQFGQVRSTFGNNANTSTNGRKMQFSFTVFY